MSADTSRFSTPRQALDELAPWALDLLSKSIAFRSESGSEGPFVRYLADAADAVGLSVDLWQADESDLATRFGPLPPHKPLAGRPTLVIRLPGSGGGPSLVFNAHSDVVAAPASQPWTSDPWTARHDAGLIFGRGACDTKGPLVSAFWALHALAKFRVPLAGDVLLEIIPGEEDCVGLGTLTSIARGHTADAAVILEPTQSLPRCASRPGLRFVITTLGRSVHGTVKWLGQDAIAHMHLVQTALADLERRWTFDPDPLFASYPIPRPMTVDFIRGGEWQGMVADRCALAGYLECLPADDLPALQARFQADLHDATQRLGLSPQSLHLDFTETYQGHRLDPAHPLAGHAQAAFESVAAYPANAFPPWPGWQAFNSGCEAGVRANRLRTPTLIWGPGDLAHAHAADEHVRFDDVRSVARMFTALAHSWCRAKEHA